MCFRKLYSLLLIEREPYGRIRRDIGIVVRHNAPRMAAKLSGEPPAPANNAAAALPAGRPLERHVRAQTERPRRYQRLEIARFAHRLPRLQSTGSACGTRMKTTAIPSANDTTNAQWNATNIPTP